MSNHTSTPWTVNDRGGIARPLNILGGDGRPVCTFSGNSQRPLAEVRANARLLAAAPAMRAALVLLIDGHGHECECCYCNAARLALKSAREVTP